MQFKNIALLALSSTAAAEFVIITSTPIPTDIAGALAHVNISHPLLLIPLLTKPFSPHPTPPPCAT
jgi:hypothetical protein